MRNLQDYQDTFIYTNHLLMLKITYTKHLQRPNPSGHVVPIYIRLLLSLKHQYNTV